MTVGRAALVALLLCSCASKEKDPGTEGGPCYGNGTCNAGLSCASNLCVRIPGRETGVDRSVADQLVRDASTLDQRTQDSGALDRPISDKFGPTPEKAGPVADKSATTPDKLGPTPDFMITAAWANIPSGMFVMGSPVSEPCRGTQEDQHTVTLTNALEMQTTEVTQAQFKALMGYDPTLAVGCNGNCAVQNVSWHEAVAYCNALSAKNGLATCYTCTGSGVNVTCDVAPQYTGAKIYTCPGYRLPTEAEWEYAYRAGTKTAYYSGDNDPLACKCSPLDQNLDKIGWYCGNWYSGAPRVALKLPNAWGLFDMAGSVMEWCHDWDPGPLGMAPVTNPWGAQYAVSRMCRGGSANGDGAQRTRAADRYCRLLPTLRGPAVGFRTCRTKP